MDRARRWQDLCLCPGCQAWSGPDRTHPEQLAGPPYWQCDCAGDHPLGGAVERVLSRHHPSVAQCSQAGRRCSSCPLISLMHAPFLVVSLHDMHEMLMHLLHLFQRVTIMVCFQVQLYPLASCCRSSADQLLQELNTTQSIFCPAASRMVWSYNLLSCCRRNLTKYPDASCMCQPPSYNDGVTSSIICLWVCLLQLHLMRICRTCCCCCCSVEA